MITLDSSKVTSYVFPNIDKTDDYIQYAYNSGENLASSLPNDFYHLQEVRESNSDLKTISSGLSETKSNISSKMDKAEAIEAKGDSAIGGLKALVASIGKTIMTAGAAATSGIESISSKVTSSLTSDESTGAKEASNGFFSSLLSLGSEAVDGIKNVGAAVVNGAKTFVNDIKSGNVERANIVDESKSWFERKLDEAIAFGKDVLEGTGAFISEVGSTLWNETKELVGEAINFGERVAATIVNAQISLAKGVARLTESIVDTVEILNSTLNTVGTGLADIGHGLFTGDWSWQYTKQEWEKTRAFVSKEWVDDAFKAFYETDLGKTLDEYAFEPFKSDGIGCEILTCTSEVAGIVLLSMVTGGAAGVTFGTTLTAGGVTINAGALGLTTAFAYLGHDVSQEWNNNSVSINYNGIDVDIPINYEKYNEIKDLQVGASTNILQTIVLPDGTQQDLVFKITSTGDGTYSISDDVGDTAYVKSINKTNTAAGLVYGTKTAALRGLKYYGIVATFSNLLSFGSLIKKIGNGNITKGFSTFLKTIKFKQAFKPLATNALKNTFTKSSFYINSASLIADEVRTGVSTGEWDVGKIASRVGWVGFTSFLGNMRNDYISLSTGTRYTTSLIPTLSLTKDVVDYDYEGEFEDAAVEIEKPAA